MALTLILLRPAHADAWASASAVFNGLSLALLLTGFYFIRRRNIAAHRRAMLSAFAASVLFLFCYVMHHLRAGLVRFSGGGWRRELYLWVLGTHTPLAMVIVPLAIVTIRLGWRGRYARHRAWARWTLPIWLYVSSTGLLVYWMLYRWK